jgi:hypothetical protein
MRSHSALNLSVPSAGTDRRQLSRLRDLCDEVLASFRLAAGQDPISDQDRHLATQLMPALVPLGRRR